MPDTLHTIFKKFYILFHLGPRRIPKRPSGTVATSRTLSQAVLGAGVLLLPVVC